MQLHRFHPESTSRFCAQHAWALLPTLTGALLTAACTTAPGPTLAEVVPDLEQRVGAPLCQDLPWDQPSPAWDGRAPLSAQAVLTTALQNNRALRRSLFEIDRRRARYQDSQLAPNPTLELASGVPLDMGVTPILAMVSAQVDWLWKREALVGETDSALRSALFQAASLTVVTATDARAAYVEAGSSWEILTLSLADVEIATRVLEASNQAFAAGELKASAVNDARMGHSEASIRAMEAHESFLTAQLRLLKVMGRGDLDTQWLVVATSAKSAADECLITATSPPLDHQELFDLVRERRLDLVAAQARVDGAASRVKLTKASQWPTIMLGGGWERDMEGDTAAVIGGTITLPIFNQGQFRVRAAEAELEIARIDADALWQQALIEVRRTLNAVAVAEHHIVQIRDYTLAAFDANKRLLADGVEAGELAPIRLWQSEHQENHVRIQLANAQRNGVLAALGLERALAGTSQPGAIDAGGGGMGEGPDAGGSVTGAASEVNGAALEGMQ